MKYSRISLFFQLAYVLTTSLSQEIEPDIVGDIASSVEDSTFLFSPFESPSACGRDTVPRSAICDPDNILLTSTKDEIDGYSYFPDLYEKVAVVTKIKTKFYLKDESLEDASVRLARSLHDQWGVGDKERQNGFLVFVSIADRRIYISVGSGISRVLTDEVLDGVIANMKPQMRQQAYGAAISQCVVELVLLLSGKAEHTANLSEDSDEEEAMSLLASSDTDSSTGSGSGSGSSGDSDSSVAVAARGPWAALQQQPWAVRLKRYLSRRKTKEAMLYAGSAATFAGCLHVAHRANVMQREAEAELERLLLEADAVLDNETSPLLDYTGPVCPLCETPYIGGRLPLKDVPAAGEALLDIKTVADVGAEGVGFYQPTSLNCGHVVCLACYKKLPRTGDGPGPTCPICFTGEAADATPGTRQPHLPQELKRLLSRRGEMRYRMRRLQRKHPFTISRHDVDYFDEVTSQLLRPRRLSPTVGTSLLDPSGAPLHANADALTTAAGTAGEKAADSGARLGYEPTTQASPLQPAPRGPVTVPVRPKTSGDAADASSSAGASSAPHTVRVRPKSAIVKSTAESTTGSSTGSATGSAAAGQGSGQGGGLGLERDERVSVSERFRARRAIAAQVRAAAARKLLQDNSFRASAGASGRSGTTKKKGGGRSSKGRGGSW